MTYEEWSEIFEDFKRHRPGIEDRGIVEWFPSGRMEITILMADGTHTVYDYIDKSTTYYKKLRNSDEETEEQYQQNLGRYLRRAMGIKGITQKELAEITGISVITLSKYMNGKATPSSYNLRKLVNALGCSPSEIQGLR